MNNDRYDNIVEYLTGTMTDESKKFFEKELLTDESLQEDINIFKALHTSLKQDEAYSENDKALMASLLKLNTSFFKHDDSGIPGVGNHAVHGNEKKYGKTKIKWITNPVWLAAAAVFTGLIVFTAIWFMQNKENSSIADVQNTKIDSAASIAKADTTFIKKEKTGENIIAKQEEVNLADKKTSTAVLYTQNFKRAKVPADVPEEIDFPIRNYEKGNYKTAVAAFKIAKQNAVSRGDETDTTLLKFNIYYYTGQSLMALGEINEAIPQLQNALHESPNDSLEAETQWYLALAYIKNNNAKKALDILKPLSVNTKAKQYKTKASNLVKELTP